MEKRILLVGGGSGGHAYPLLAVAQSLATQAKQKGINLKLLLMGDNRGFLERAAKDGDLPFKFILAGALRRYFSPRLIIDLIKIPISMIQALWYVFWFMPDAVFSKGGYDSVAPALAARLYAIPVYMHESDTIPGLANRIVAWLARRIFISFASSEVYFPGKAVLTGNPVRPELFAADRTAALQHFSFTADKRTILIFGGSQGAKEINDVITNSLVELVRDYQIIHQCGDTQYETVRAAVDTFIKEGGNLYGTAIERGYRLYPFLHSQELAMAYAAADIIISRAGSGSLFEIAMLGKPAIIIPLISAANGHQISNAVEFARTGVSVIEGANMTTHILVSQVKALLEPSRSTEVREKLKLFAKPGAAKDIASAILAEI